MALKDLLPSTSWSLGVGLGTGILGAGGVAAGMVFNAGFASWVLGLTIAGFSLGGLGLPLAASIAIAAVAAGVGAFVVGAATYAVSNTVLNVVSSVFSWVGGLFSGNSAQPPQPGPKPSANPSANPAPVSSHLKTLGGTAPEQQTKPAAVIKAVVTETVVSGSNPDNNHQESPLDFESSSHTSESSSASMG